MKMMINRCSTILGQEPFQFCKGSLPNGCDGSKCFQQLLLTLWADTGNLIQLGITKPFTSFLTMIVDGKAMDFFLNGTDEGKDRLFCINAYLVPFWGIRLLLGWCGRQCAVRAFRILNFYLSFRCQLRRIYVKECDGTHSEYCARRVPTLRK